MKDYRPYIKLFQVSKENLNKLENIGVLPDKGKKELLSEISLNFYKEFWNNYKHLIHTFEPKIKSDIFIIFKDLENEEPNQLNKLSESFKKTEKDVKEFFPQLSNGILSEIRT